MHFSYAGRQGTGSYFVDWWTGGVGLVPCLHGHLILSIAVHCFVHRRQPIDLGNNRVTNNQGNRVTTLRVRGVCPLALTRSSPPDA